MNAAKLLGRLVAMAAVAACTKDAPEVPMPQGEGLGMVLASNYSMAAAQLKFSSTTLFAANFADTGVIAATPLGVLRGRDEIGRKLGALGLSMGFNGWERKSDGWRVTGRIVTDSGRYAIQGVQAGTPILIDLNGRYWTTWHFTPGGTWEIIADTLIGDGKTKELLPRR